MIKIANEDIIYNIFEYLGINSKLSQLSYWIGKLGCGCNKPAIEYNNLKKTCKSFSTNKYFKQYICIDSQYFLLYQVNNHMNTNTLYPGDWYPSFYTHINKLNYKFTNITNMILEIGAAFRSIGDVWCRENITGYKHSEDYKNISLSKTIYVYDESKESLFFWRRFLAQMLIYRYG